MFASLMEAVDDYSWIKRFSQNLVADESLSFFYEGYRSWKNVNKC